MRKHPASLHFSGPLNVPLDEIEGPTEIFRGSVRELCPMAPNNVNTMAVLAMASGLGFDAVEACFVVDPSLDVHITEVELLGPPASPRYSLALRRVNPAARGAVTGSATVRSFVRSVVRASGRGSGIHFV